MDWINRFETKCKLLGVEEENMADWCRILVGEIGELVLKGEPVGNWQEMKIYLNRHLGARDLAQESLRFLNTLKKDTEETDRQMAARAKCLARQAFPDTPANIQEREAINAFIKSYPAELQYELRKGGYKTTDEVCSMAEKLQDINKQINSMKMATVQMAAASTAAENEATEKEAQGVLALRKEIEGLKLEVRGRQTSEQKGSWDIECWSCGARGHVQRNCPRRKSGRTERWTNCNKTGHKRDTCWAKKPHTKAGRVTSERPFDIISIDIMGPLGGGSQRFILTVLDNFSGFVILIPCNNHTTKHLAQMLHKHVFSVFCLPERILSDRATEHTAQL